MPVVFYVKIRNNHSRKAGRSAILTTIGRTNECLEQCGSQRGCRGTERVKYDEAVRGLLLQVPGEKSLTAGADISESKGKTPITQRATFFEKNAVLR